jgi:hypothetical protein
MPSPKKSLILDTNLLVLLVLGSVDRERIPDGKRTQEYTVSDWDNLIQFISVFDQIVVSPYILAETSNLADVYTGDMKKLPFLELKNWMEKDEFVEKFIPAKTIVESRFFTQYGLTDACVIEMADDYTAILTNDGPLANHARAEGKEVFTIQDIRSLLNETYE